MEPVVGIGRFNPMNGVKIADLLRKSTSLGKSLLLSTSHFTGQSSGQFSGLRGKRSNPVGTHSKRHRLWGPLPSGHDSKLFPPLWTDFLPLGQKCHFRPISKDSNRSYLDTIGLQVTRFTAWSMQVGVYKSRLATGNRLILIRRRGYASLETRVGMLGSPDTHSPLPILFSADESAVQNGGL
jgi:hypothetical protein